jgi:hypothetical protein
MAFRRSGVRFPSAPPVIISIPLGSTSNYKVNGTIAVVIQPDADPSGAVVVSADDAPERSHEAPHPPTCC